jgi:hypothetical protein
MQLWDMIPRDLEMMIDAKLTEQTRTRRFLDLLNGKLCATFAEPYRDRDQHPDPFSASEFTIIPPEEPEEDPAPQQPQQGAMERIWKSISAMKMWVMATGGTPNG